MHNEYIIQLTLSGSRQQETQISYNEQHPTGRQFKQLKRFVVGDELSQQPDDNRLSSEHTKPIIIII